MSPQNLHLVMVPTGLNVAQSGGHAIYSANLIKGLASIFAESEVRLHVHDFFGLADAGFPNFVDHDTFVLLDTNGFNVDEQAYYALKANYSNLRYVVTYHDLQHHYHPDNFGQDEIVRRVDSESFAKDHADMAICISQRTEQDLLDCHPGYLGRTHVARHGHDHSFGRVDGGTLAGHGMDARSHLGKRVWLFPAKGWHHKGHLDVLEQVAHHQRELRRNQVLLCMTGHLSSELLASIGATIRRHAIDDLVHVHGLVPESGLRYLYGLSDILIFPSAFEGYGLPVAEGMALGSVVVCTDELALREFGLPDDQYCDISEIVAKAIGLMREGSDTLQARRELQHSSILSETWKASAMAHATAFGWTRMMHSG